jgi:hypothetical protein
MTTPHLDETDAMLAILDAIEDQIEEETAFAQLDEDTFTGKVKMAAIVVTSIYREMATRFSEAPTEVSVWIKKSPDSEPDLCGLKEPTRDFDVPSFCRRLRAL